MFRVHESYRAGATGTQIALSEGMTSRAQELAARRKMAAFISRQTGAKLDDDATIHDGHIVIGGEWSQCQAVAAYMYEQLDVEGVEVDELDPELAPWTCVRIPLEGLEKALADLKAAMGGRGGK